MLQALKEYKKRYLTKNLVDLDESGTRLMINTFLVSILGYLELEEIKTEFMIKGTYADYIVQTGGKRHFLVEVKAFSLDLSDKHLRQAINYGANEGIEWAILTNGRQFQFYKILFEKPICEKLVFEIDFQSDSYDVKGALDQLIYFHKDAIVKKSLDNLWARHSALEPTGLASLLFSPHVISFLKKELKTKYDTKFEDDDILDALTEVVCTEIPSEKLKIPKFKAAKKKVKIPIQRTDDTNNILSQIVTEGISDLPLKG
jgi:Type I restriction enzyme R protein N terminus (HSDR_N)